jgi:hypothetical protein
MSSKAELAKDIAFLETLLLISEKGSKEDLEKAIKVALEALKRCSEK